MRGTIGPKSCSPPTRSRASISRASCGSMPGNGNLQHRHGARGAAELTSEGVGDAATDVVADQVGQAQFELVDELLDARATSTAVCRPGLGAEPPTTGRSTATTVWRFARRGI